MITGASIVEGFNELVNQLTNKVLAERDKVRVERDKVNAHKKAFDSLRSHYDNALDTIQRQDKEINRQRDVEQNRCDKCDREIVKQYESYIKYQDDEIKGLREGLGTTKENDKLQKMVDHRNMILRGVVDNYRQLYDTLIGIANNEQAFDKDVISPGLAKLKGFAATKETMYAEEG